MSSFVKKVADRYYPRSFAHKVRRQTGSATSKWSYEGIQFPAPISQVHTGDGEIAGAENGDGGKKYPVLAIQKPVLARGFG